MNTTASRFQLGTAAFVLTAAATLAPVVAQADTAAPLRPALTSFAQGLGETAGQPVGVVCAGPDATSACTVVDAAQANALASANASSSGSWFKSLFQNQLWWFGAPNPNPPTQNVILEFQPVNIPLVGWFFRLFPNLNFEACVLGFTTTIGPYGTTTISTSRGCA